MTRLIVLLPLTVVMLTALYVYFVRMGGKPCTTLTGTRWEDRHAD